MEPSELQGELRNDGRSVHHRSELEKEVAAIEAKLMKLREEVFELGTQESRNFQIGGA